MPGQYQWCELLDVSINGYRSQATIVKNGNSISLFIDKMVSLTLLDVLPDCGDGADSDTGNGLAAPMNGTMVSVLIAAGDQVEKDQPLMIMEAMKMEHTIRAPANGTVESIYFNEGEMVDGGVELLAFTAEEA